MVNAGSDSTIDDIFDGGGTVSYWVKPGGPGGGEGDQAHMIFKRGSDTGWNISTQPCDSDSVDIYMRVENAATDGAWRSNCVLNVDEWNYVSISYDDDAISNDPAIYDHSGLVCDVDNPVAF